MTIAINDAGDVMAYTGGAWKPAVRAVNDKTGEMMALDGDAWKSIPTPKAPSEAPDTSAAMTDFPTYAAPASPEPAPGNAAIERIGGAAAKAFNETPEVLTPVARDALNKYGGTGPFGVGEFANQVAHGATNVIGAARGGMAALSQAAMEVFGEKGGRDALALLSSIPVPEGQQLASMRANSPAALAKTELPVAAPAGTGPNPESFPQSVPLAQLDTRNAIQKLIEEQIYQDNPSLAPRGTANQGTASLARIGSATDVDGAIAAAGEAAQAPVSRPVSQWMQPLSKQAEAQSAADVLPAQTEPQPLSIGAASSRDATPANQIALSPVDMKANRYQGEMNEILAPPASGDKTVYVPNSLPTLAEYSGDPLVSQQEHLLRERNPAAFVGDGKRLTENNNARVAEFENQTPSRTALTTMRDQRDTQWKADTEGILPTAKPVDFTPALDWVDGQLSNPRIAENDAVRSVLENFRDRLINDDGTPKTDPAAAWGIHDNIQTQLAKAKDPLNATGSEKYAFNELMEAKKHVDGALNLATDNRFQTALDNFAKASQAINAGEELEAFRPKLTNASGTIMGDRFHKFVLDLAQRRGDPGIDPAMSISDETMRSLINIDNDLKRAGLIKMGGALGSPTNLLGALAERVGMGAAHSALGAIPGVGPILKVGADYLGQRRLEGLTAKHLAEPEGGYVFPNAP